MSFCEYKKITRQDQKRETLKSRGRVVAARQPLKKSSRLAAIIVVLVIEIRHVFTLQDLLLDWVHGSCGLRWNEKFFLGAIMLKKIILGPYIKL